MLDLNLVGLNIFSTLYVKSAQINRNSKVFINISVVVLSKKICSDGRLWFGWNRYQTIPISKQKFKLSDSRFKGHDIDFVDFVDMFRL